MFCVWQILISYILDHAVKGCLSEPGATPIHMSSACDGGYSFHTLYNFFISLDACFVAGLGNLFSILFARSTRDGGRSLTPASIIDISYGKHMTILVSKGLPSS